jgi:hypothetical protein
MTKPNVFISSSLEGRAIATELGRQLESSATITLWPECEFSCRTAINSLTEVADRSDFAVFVLAAEDVTMNQKSPSRANVIFELGFLSGRLGLSRTFVVITDPAKTILPSDLAGVMYIELKGRNRNLKLKVAPAAAAIQKMISEIHVRKDRPTEYYSCFLSYSWADQDFAERLHDDLQKIGIRCWFAPKNMKVGDRLADQIDRAIQVHDKVILILSRASVQSKWVQLEVKHALNLEHDRQKTVLFPIRLDDAVLNVSGIKEIDKLKQKYIGDFRQWQAESNYQKAFSRLVRDLAISASVESGRHF